MHLLAITLRKTNAMWLFKYADRCHTLETILINAVPL